MVMSGDAQVGFVGSQDCRRQLHYECVAEDRLVLVTPNTERFAQMREAGTMGKSLLSEPIIFREHGSGTQKMIDGYLNSIDIDPKRLNVIACVSDTKILLSLVSMQAGVSVLSVTAAEEAVCSGAVLQFELDSHPVTRSIYMVYRKRSALSDLARDFVSLARRENAQER